jgi:hypothetical protein
MIVAFRRHTLLPLDDCLYACSRRSAPLTRSSLHRCLQRHGISRLPDMDGDKPKSRSSSATRSASSTSTSPRCGPPRASSISSWPLTEPASSPCPAGREGGQEDGLGVPGALLDAVPYRIHTILTDNGIQFAEQPRNRNTIISRPMRFDMICEANGIEHRLTKPNHPWTNGQVERMNRTIKDATVKRYHYDSHEQLAQPSRGLPRCLQLRPPSQDPQRPHALRVHLQDLDFRARSIHRRSDPPDAGTEHFKWFKTSPWIIRLAVMMYVRFPTHRGTTATEYGQRYPKCYPDKKAQRRPYRRLSSKMLFLWYRLPGLNGRPLDPQSSALTN